VALRRHDAFLVSTSGSRTQPRKQKELALAFNCSKNRDGSWTVSIFVELIANPGPFCLQKSK